MNISGLLQSIVQYITEGFAKIFAPTHDEYPNVGIQPFEGESYQNNSDNDLTFKVLASL